MSHIKKNLQLIMVDPTDNTYHISSSLIQEHVDIFDLLHEEDLELDDIFYAVRLKKDCGGIDYPRWKRLWEDL